MTNSRPAATPFGGPTETHLALKSDGELVAKVKDGSRDAFAVLWTRHFAAAKTCAKNVWPDENEADDIVSEAFVRVLKTIKEGGGPSDRFRPYLYQVIRNLAVDRHRRAEPLDNDLGEAAASDASVEDKVLAEIDEELTLRAYYAMRPRERHILWLHEVEDLSPREIAAQVGLDARHVSTLLNRARKAFSALWLQAHVETIGAGEGEHGWCLNRVGQMLMGQASDKTKTRMREHLSRCESCGRIVAEVGKMASKFGLILGPAVLGVAAEALAVTPHASAAEIASPPAMPPAVSAEFPVAGHAAVQGGIVGGSIAVFALVLLFASSNPSQTILALPVPPPAASAATVPGPSPTPSATVPSGPASASPSPVATVATDPSPAAPATTPAPVVVPPKVVPPEIVPPISIAGVDSGPENVCYPTVWGTAKGNSALVLSNGFGAPVHVQTQPDGTWRAGPLTGFTAGSRNLRVWDASGAQPSATRRVSLAAPPALDASRSGIDLLVGVIGVPGRSVSVSIDGVVLEPVTLDQAGRARIDQAVPVASKGHTVAVRYAAPCLTPENSMYFSS